jgi:Flp pilus assembly protein TadG
MSQIKDLAMQARNVLRIEGDRQRRAVLCGIEGAQLLEFALVLPLLLVLVLGIVDFAQIYNLKQKLNNATREGARFAITLNCVDCYLSSPPSTLSVRDVVANYLTSANITTCAVGSSPSSVGPWAWQYSSTTAGSGCSNFALIIDRGTFVVDSSGNRVPSTRVTLTYPVTWSFNKVIGLLVSGANPVLPPTITTDSIMQNLM